MTRNDTVAPEVGHIFRIRNGGLAFVLRKHEDNYWGVTSYPSGSVYTAELWDDDGVYFYVENGSGDEDLMEKIESIPTAVRGTDQIDLDAAGRRLMIILSLSTNANVREGVSASALSVLILGLVHDLGLIIEDEA